MTGHSGIVLRRMGFVMPGQMPLVGVFQQGHEAVGTEGRRLGLATADMIIAMYWLLHPAAIEVERLTEVMPVGGTVIELSPTKGMGRPVLLVATAEGMAQAGWRKISTTLFVPPAVVARRERRAGEAKAPVVGVGRPTVRVRAWPLNPAGTQE